MLPSLERRCEFQRDKLQGWGAPTGESVHRLIDYSRCERVAESDEHEFAAESADLVEEGASAENLTLFRQLSTKTSELMRRVRRNQLRLSPRAKLLLSKHVTPHGLGAQGGTQSHSSGTTPMNTPVTSAAVKSATSTTRFLLRCVSCVTGQHAQSAPIRGRTASGICSPVFAKVVLPSVPTRRSST